MRLKIFGHYMQLPLALSWLAEAAVAVLACRIGGYFSGALSAGSDALWVLSFVFGLCVIVAMMSMGLFNQRLRDRLIGVSTRIMIAVVGGAVVATAIFSTWTNFHTSRNLAATSALFALLGLVATRAIGLRLINEDRFKKRVLIYGAGRSAVKVSMLRRRTDQRGFKLLGFVSAYGEECRVPGNRVLEPAGSLSDFALAQNVDEIVIAMDDRREQFPHRELLVCRLAGITIIELISFLERETGKVHLDLLYPSWMIFGQGFRRDGWRVYSERLFDLVASTWLLLWSSPAILLAVLAIKIEDGWGAPIFYRQRRVGYGGRPFDVLKFRSMRTDAESDGKAQWATVNDSRITRVGAFLRKARIDELPQLINVLRGEMSFVGPRPERPEFVSKLAEKIPFYLERHAVKPGITGWAQLCYSYGASEQDAVEKLQYDLFYVKNHDLIFDILILLQTVEVIIFGKGAR